MDNQQLSQQVTETQTLTPVKESVDKETLTVQKFKEAYIRLGNATKAYMELHPECSYNSARSLGSRMLAKVNIGELMEDMGLTDKALIQQIAVGIVKPTRQVQKKIITYEEIPVNAEQKFVKDKKGRIVLLGTKTVTEFEYEEVPDYEERRKNTEIALKLKKKLSDKNVELSVGEMTVNVVNYANEATSPTNQPENT